MAINFNGQTTIINSQIGDNNTAYYNDSLTENDWKNIEHFFTKSLKEIDNDCELYDFFNESKKYASDKNAVELKHHFKKNWVCQVKCVSFFIFYQRLYTAADFCVKYHFKSIPETVVKRTVE